MATPVSRIPVVVIGAGHAGLSVSWFLSQRSIDHVVLERGEVANTWRTQRWDSLRLLTPNWQNRLPGFAYDGDDGDGYMTMPEVVDFIDRYARVANAPVIPNSEVHSVSPSERGYRVVTQHRAWEAPAVVLATGGFNQAHTPQLATELPDGVDSVTTLDYRSPDQLREGAVLVVGASASGVQIADELARSGRRVTVAVGGHVRMPRMYRGRDIQWWLSSAGILDERYDQVDDIVRARHVPSPQLVGTPERNTLDLNTLSARGVELVGRFVGVNETVGHFSGSLANVCKLADLKQTRLLNTIDEWVTDSGLDEDVPTPERFDPTWLPDQPRLSVDLAREGFATVLWATGYRPDYSWLQVPVLDRKGEIRHDGGVVVDSPGLYRVGLNFLRRRKSSFIHGAEDDARDLTEHLEAYLRGSARHPHDALAAGVS